MPQPGEATTWIMKEPCFLDLSPQEQNEAGSFSFIWGIFELRVMHALQKAPSESLSRITCRDYANSTFIPKADLRPEIQYFKSLFFTKDGKPTEVWSSACFRDADKSDEIRAILLKTQSTFEENAEALIRIVVRFRNNFFHGFKWAYYLKGQLNNFVHASSVLVKLMPDA